MMTKRASGHLLTAACLALFMGSTPAAPKETLNFTFAMGGDVIGGGSGPEGVRGRTSPVWFKTGATLASGGLFMSDSSYGGKSAANCFGDGSVSGNIQLTKTKDGEAKAILWFSGYASDGSGAEVTYYLTLVDSKGWDGKPDLQFPPRGDTLDMLADQWSMETEGRGRLKNLSCTGSGTGSLNFWLELSQP